MLDTRFKQYQDVVIGTVLTTLHAGSVLLTFYPNLPTTLKVQIQIQGAEQISSAKIATLHHQLVYRLQNHALDLPTPEHHSDTLMVLAESDQIPTIIQIPRQIPRHELIKLMPLEWISNYEQFHNNTAPIQTSESMFERRQDGTVRMTFKPPPSAPQEPPRLSFNYSSMITAVQTAQEDLPITGFNSEGYPVYPAKHNGHFLWDAPGSGMCDPNCPCWDDWEEDDDYATTRKKKPKKKKPSVPCHHCDPKPPSDPPPPPAPLPIYRKELKWIAKHCKSEIPSPLPNPTPIVQPLACMMFSSTSSDYSSSFPSLEPHTDPQRNVVSKPFIPSPITSTGHLEPPKPFESVLNWQTQNARAQNDTLLHLNSKVENISLRTEQIETKVDSITAQMQQIYQNLQSRISQLDSELRAMLAHRYSGPEFDQKEREIRRLKAELAQIESEKQRPTLFTTSPPIPSIGPTYHPFASMLSPIKQYDPSKLFGMTHTIFRDNHLPPPPKPKPKPRPQPRPAPLHPSSLTIPGQPSPTSAPTSPPAPLLVPTQSKDKEPMHQFTAHTVTHSSTIDDPTSDSNLAVSDSPTETDTESSASTSDSEKSYADITKILMAQPDQGQTSHTEPYVNIPSEVEEEMPESSATNQPPPTQSQIVKWSVLLRPGATTQSVLREFATRFTSALRDWFDSLGQYRQLQFVDLPEVSSALAVLHDQFLGDPSAVFEAARRDYLNMKCCSLNAKDLDFHYKRMSLLFYKLNGFNEPTLKHVFLASLPEELQPNIQRQLTASNLSLDNISLGKIFQLAKTCLDKLCEQKQFFKELLKDKEPFRSACKKPYLHIKCHKKKDCDCNSKKKWHFQKFKTPEFSSKPRRSRKPYRFFRKKSSSSREFKRKQSSRCFICKRKGHYAKDCPNKREKSIRLVEHLQATTDYSPAKDELEFYFSEQDEPNDETVFALQSSSDSDNTGAQRSMLNLHILPSEYWTQSEEHFKAVNGKLFTTSLITKKPIGIQIFPNCVIWTKVIGSTLPNKDILLGFDILHQIQHLQIIPTGIRVKSMFKPFTDILKLYNLSETPQSYQDISTKLLSFCRESHSEFTHPNPLWKNKSFFIKLPFKLNEDINPTKATHPGMSHSDLLLAQQECSQLLAQGLIEPTSSQWACQAFYVEKHSEIVRGKKRLVIDYQPLNMFLQDDKFPLPRSHDDHRQLLTQFYDLIQSHGIMLSAKKSIIATDNIEFLDGRRILQTDASDESWGAILLEEINGKENFIAYASGHFSDTRKHYHSVFKEILAVKNGIKKFEYHLIGHHFLMRMDSSAFPNIFHFKGKTVPEKMLLRLKDWFSEYDFSVKHIKGSQNLIPDMLSRLSKPEHPLTLFSTTYHFPIISMATSLPPEALTKKTFPFNKTFSSVFAIQEFARRALFHFFMKAYLVTNPFPFSTFHPENLFLTGLTLDPTRETTEDVLWYIWCLTVLYATNSNNCQNFTTLSVCLKWRDRLNEMSAWIDLQMLRPGATTQSVLREFATRFTGALRDWFDSLGQYRQLQFVELPEVSSALAVLHDQFLGDPFAVFEAARQDYLNMKCCSLNAKDLDFHYKRMSLLFYKLNGFNEPTLKHVFLASLSEELQPNIQRQLTASNLSLDNISLGKIFQLAKTCLDKLCEQKQFFKELLKVKEPFRSACKKPYLQIKCHKKKDCDCNSKKKQHFRKFKTRRSRKPYRFFRKKSSSSREFKRKQSSRCFICKRKGHYAKDCPNKREKAIRLVEHLQATTDYSPAKDELEFYFSEQDEPNDETVFALQSSSDSDSDQSQVIFHQQLLSLDTTVPIPSIKLQILPSKFQRPIPAIGLIDTGAQRSMLNPHILPSEYWTQSEEHFKAVNGNLFTTSLITKKPIGIQIFPNCVIWTKVIGSTLPNKDILLGFDILHQIKHLQIIPTGIRVKSMFKPFTNLLKLYNLSETPQSYQDISTKLLSFCPESHSEFTHPNPLWKNKSFFIKLPFKLNEDINPTKATHPGMSPSDLLLAQQECSQLLAQGSHDEHRQLLTQFYDILQSHGIMLSAKKSIIATDNVEFLGMIIKDGHYQPGKHIAQELLHFPDQQLSKRQIQQFLGIINYIRDFIPHVDRYTHHLSALLKKKPPEWNADHTIAVTTLKQIAQNPPPLKLITDGRRILQTDASDESWGAILLEEINGKENFIAYASGHFSDTQKHYHSVFKEILAVKNGIKKFEYHLIGHHFLIRMDSSAFPNIFHFKGKTVPEKMLLRLKDWFSKYDFSVKHIKRSQNLIPDMLSRLSKPENPLTLFSTTYHFPIISMATSLPPGALTKKTFPFNKTYSSVFAIQEFARKALFRFFMKAYLVTDPFPFSTFHPENLFLTGLTLDPTRETTEDVLWYIWCLTVLYATKLVLPITPTLEHLFDPDKATSLTWT
ncbi:hypothetical protein KPL71_021595 [Citrus sinensis]|uniref:Uncharacterized protein n=1 Tax=Citrus sinensis TaxID=2711 RepID=A0ACB8JGF5_CITSI|nr:hypothetical protein KPL71_021595 [Citrus sinensis]